MTNKLSIYKIFGIYILLSFISGPIQVLAFSSPSDTNNEFNLVDLSLNDQDFLSLLSNADESLSSLTTGLSREEAALKGLEDYAEKFSIQEQTALVETPEVIGDPKISEDLVQIFYIRMK